MEDRNDALQILNSSLLFKEHAFFSLSSISKRKLSQFQTINNVMYVPLLLESSIGSSIFIIGG